MTKVSALVALVTVLSAVQAMISQNRIQQSVSNVIDRDRKLVHASHFFPNMPPAKRPRTTDQQQQQQQQQQPKEPNEAEDTEDTGEDFKLFRKPRRYQESDVQRGPLGEWATMQKVGEWVKQIPAHVDPRVNEPDFAGAQHSLPMLQR